MNANLVRLISKQLAAFNIEILFFNYSICLMKFLQCHFEYQKNRRLTVRRWANDDENEKQHRQILTTTLSMLTWGYPTFFCCKKRKGSASVKMRRPWQFLLAVREAWQFHWQLSNKFSRIYCSFGTLKLLLTAKGLQTF